jgi:hypothetical protein
MGIEPIITKRTRGRTGDYYIVPPCPSALSDNVDGQADKVSALIKELMTTTISPVYCKDCGSPNSWQRQPDQDIKGESGKILWERWRCTVCGATTITPARR